MRTDCLERAVWAEVKALLEDPQRLLSEYQRRLEAVTGPEQRSTAEALHAQVQRLRQGCSRLLDSYTEGYIDKGEFVPRFERLKHRLASLEAQARQLEEVTQQIAQLHLVIGRLEDFAAQVKEGLETMAWSGRRELIRTLVKRVEVGPEEVTVVFRVTPGPEGSGSDPEQGHFCKIVGGVLSPLLANIYLHEVLDLWFLQDVMPKLQGRAFMVRYADDLVMGFANERDARRVLSVLPKRLERYGLTLHPDKTRLVYFRPPCGQDRQREEAGSFDFLGFTHYWAQSRSKTWVVKRKTAKGRFTRALQRIKEWCQLHRHEAVRDQWRILVQKMKGHYGYYGLSGNFTALARFREEVGQTWRKWLSRRSQKAFLDWPTYSRLLQRYPLPAPRLIHSTYHRAANP